MDDHVRRSVEVLCVGVRLGVTRLANLHDELTVSRELENLILFTVAANPDETVRIDVNAMLVLRPVIAVRGSAPALDEVALRVELQHGRRGPCQLFVAQRARPLQHP
jgi:hypothetical protein